VPHLVYRAFAERIDARYYYDYINNGHLFFLQKLDTLSVALLV
jgi:hypothetical protein